MPVPISGRRRFLGSLLAASITPMPVWADAGSPAFLSAAGKPDGRFVLCGIGADLRIRFEIPLPARGHAAAAHPTRPEAVAFARRPGTFAVVIDCVSGAQKAILTAPPGRHFYGHGAYSLDGSLLFTTENDFELGRGRIGVWDTRNGYRRADEWDSAGIGPHDIKRLPASDVLVVANGGIDTHPDTGRTKLNLPTMRPNLAYIDNGQIIDSVAGPPDLRKNSIRHLAVGASGMVAFAMQWQGGGPARTLVGVHRLGQPIRFMAAKADELRKMDGYVGSIALSADEQMIAVTSPRGGILQEYDVNTHRFLKSSAMPDVSGLAAFGKKFALSAGTGEMSLHGKGNARLVRRTPVHWDNHLIAVAAG